MKLYTRFFILILIVLPSNSAFSQYAENDWEERDEWMHVATIFEAAGITPGSFVADIGCNQGYLTIHLARKVGDAGKVFAVDVKNSHLETLKEHLKSRKLHNVEVILGDYDDPKLPENLLDVVIIMDAFHEMEDYKKILMHVHEALKPGGRLLIMEKLKKSVRRASRNEQTDAHSLSLKYVKQDLTAADFEIINELHDFGDWEKDPDKTMWLIVGKKSKMPE